MSRDLNTQELEDLDGCAWFAIMMLLSLAILVALGSSDGTKTTNKSRPSSKAGN